jgi:MFS family permease
MAGVVKQPCDEGVILSRKAKSPCTPNAAPWVLAATILGSSMAFIDETALPVALPAIQSALGDHLWRRRVFSSGIGLFAFLRIARPCSEPRATDRGQGSAGSRRSPPVSNSIAIIGAFFDEERRGKAIGAWTSLTSVTLILGPVLGGYLVENVSWRGVFFINIPLAIAITIMTCLHVSES